MSSTYKPIDALVYAQIDNTSIRELNDTDKNNAFAYLGSAINDPNYSSSMSYDNQLKFFDKVLENTTIKRACCLGSESINVRIPIPADMQDKIEGHEFTFADLYIKYGYYDRSVNVPPELCPADYTPGSNSCNNFYAIYCKNIYENFKKLAGPSLESQDFNVAHDRFVRFKEDCGCYGNTAPLGDSFSTSIPRKCVFHTGCGDANATSYLDPTSRNSSCQLKICKMINDLSGAVVGGDVDIKERIVQNCNDKATDSTSTGRNVTSYGVGGSGISQTGAKDYSSNRSSGIDATQGVSQQNSATIQDRQIKSKVNNDPASQSTISNIATNNQTTNSNTVVSKNIESGATEKKTGGTTVTQSATGDGAGMITNTTDGVTKSSQTKSYDPANDSTDSSNNTTASTSGTSGTGDQSIFAFLTVFSSLVGCVFIIIVAIIGLYLASK